VFAGAAAARAALTGWWQVKRWWLLLAQAVTVAVVFFLLAVLVAPEMLPGRKRTVVLGTGSDPAPVARTETVASYSAGALRAMPSVVSVYAVRAPPRSLPGIPLWPFADPEEDRGGGGLGSGVVMSRDGHILTNNHVIQGAGAIAVALAEGRPAPAEVVGTDPETDLAVLKIEGRNLQPIALGDSDGAQIGDVVLAIGNPFGVGQTVTQGIVSGTGRNRVGINTFENFIQTDAAINPGNSGGALVDAAGRLIGINTAILSPSGGNLGIGFAIPARTATEVMTQLLQDGRVERGWLGVEAQTLTPDLARELGIPGRSGAIIIRILRGGPADRGGMEPGDVVVAVNGKPITDTVDLINETAAIKPGNQGKFTVIRSGNEIELTVTTGRRPPIRPEALRR
jgi:serine protease DegQ